MRNKFVRLLVKDFQIKLGLLFLLAIVSLLVLLERKSEAQGVELRQLREKRELVTHIPELERLEKKLKLEEERKALGKLPKKTPGFVLSGIFIEHERNAAIINGRVYHEGDSVGSFTVSEITLKSVILRDQNTDKVMTLVF